MSVKIKMTDNCRKNEGFSLIELLVAASIFVLLTSIAAVSYSAASQRARDGRRQSDLEALRGALEIYRVDNNEYPFSIGFGAMASTLVAGDYLSEVPADPRPTEYTYFYDSTDGRSYVLCAFLETGTGTDCNTTSCGTSNCNYQVISP